MLNIEYIERERGIYAVTRAYVGWDRVIMNPPADSVALACLGDRWDGLGRFWLAAPIPPEGLMYEQYL